MTATVEQRVHKVLTDHLALNQAAIRPEQTIMDDLGGDELDIIEVIMALEDEFSIEIPDEMVGEAGDDKITVGSLVGICTKLLGENV